MNNKKETMSRNLRRRRFINWFLGTRVRAFLFAVLYRYVNYISVAGLAAILMASLLVLALLCPLVVLGTHQDGHEVCQHYAWVLVPEAAIFFVAAVAWLPHAFRFSRLQEYPLLVFRPPRLLSA
jgi:dipeptide/tripeptide permease